MKTRAGFTLIELMTVVAIIALLMAVLMPALGRASRQAKAVACQVKLKHWGLIYKMYADENNNEFTAGTHYEPLGDEPRGIWFVELRKYYGEENELLVCPTATKRAENNQDYGTFKAWDEEYSNILYIGSYCENSWICSHEPPSLVRPLKYYWRKVGNVKNPNLVPVLGDGTHFDAWVRHRDDPPKYADGGASGNVLGMGKNMQHFCINRHDGFINMLFADWTVRKVGLKELWTLKWHRWWELDEDGVFDPSPWVASGDYEPNWRERAPWLVRFKDY